jgi:tetratricopeptide (TPR) repeat protein
VIKVRSGDSELHEQWMTAALVMLSVCVIPAVAFCLLAAALTILVADLPHYGVFSGLNLFLQHSGECLGLPMMILANVSIFFAFLATVGWALVRGAHALRLSQGNQRLIAQIYVSLLALAAVLGYRNLAWLPYSASSSINSFCNRTYQANPYLEMTLAINPEFAKAYFDRGVKKAAAGEASAINDFNKVISLHPDNDLDSQTRAERSKLYAKSGDFASAIADLQHAMENRSFSEARFKMRLASYFRQSKQYDKALDVYNKLIAQSPGDAQAYQQRSEIYMHQENVRQALADIDAAILWDQNNSSYYIQRAEIFTILGDTALATQDYNTVVNRFSSYHDENSRTYRSVAIAEQRLGLLDKSKKHFAMAAEATARDLKNNFQPEEWQSDY